MKKHWMFLGRVSVVAGLLFGALVVAPSAGWSDDPATTPTPVAASAPAYNSEDLSRAGFAPAPPGGRVEDTISGGSLLVGAYAVMWAVLGGYVIFLARKQAAVAKDVAAIEKSMRDVDERLADFERVK